ncbi:MAG: hypothetical protein JSU69_06980 [Candidatus Zixiibacteriota bacterium]|nr:MAG: hypothetical protein JSU69_06980 [candidate division Zixibacteria bacterium]
MPKPFISINLATLLLIMSVVAMSFVACGKKGGRTMPLSMRQFIPEKIPGWRLQDSVESYDRQTIFDYIDGAGEVYRSYGFRKVEVYRFTADEKPEITVEIFDMGSPDDAYGVFSHAREEEEPGIGEAYEFRGSLICFWKAAYFVCALAEEGTPETKAAVFALAREIDRALPASQGRPALVNSLPEENLISNTVRYFHTHPSLNYHYFLSEENVLNLGPQTSAVLAAYKPGSIYLLYVQYPSAAEADNARSRFIEKYAPEAAKDGVGEIEKGRWIGVAAEKEHLTIVLDAPTGDYAGNLMAKIRDDI